jgi:nucleoside-diphosphate-sugar epimerase
VRACLHHDYSYRWQRKGRSGLYFRTVGSSLRGGQCGSGPGPGFAVPFSRVELTDFGQTMAAFSQVDDRIRNVTGIVHLAAIPAPGLAPNAVTFATNTISTYNVFEAARQLGIKNIVWASSETVLGLPFDTPPPYVPIDEEYPGRPESAYSLSKLVGEELAKQFCR